MLFPQMCECRRLARSSHTKRWYFRMRQCKASRSLLVPTPHSSAVHCKHLWLMAAEPPTAMATSESTICHSPGNSDGKQMWPARWGRRPHHPALGEGLTRLGLGGLALPPPSDTGTSLCSHDSPICRVASQLTLS